LDVHRAGGRLLRTATPDYVVTGMMFYALIAIQDGGSGVLAYGTKKTGEKRTTMRQFLATMMLGAALATTASAALASGGPNGGPGNGGGQIVNVSPQYTGVQTTHNDQSMTVTPSNQSPQPFVYRQGAR
jgi:hypothetical protein